MAVEYDEEKSQKTFRERAIGFDYVSRIFESDYIEKKDRRRDYGEGRLVAIAKRTYSSSCTLGAMGAGKLSQAGALTGESGMPAKRPMPGIKPEGKVDWERVEATTDEDIARQIAEDPDTAPELTEEDLDEAWLVSRSRPAA